MVHKSYVQKALKQQWQYQKAFIFWVQSKLILQFKGRDVNTSTRTLNLEMPTEQISLQHQWHKRKNIPLNLIGFVNKPIKQNIK